MRAPLFLVVLLSIFTPLFSAWSLGELTPREKFNLMRLALPGALDVWSPSCSLSAATRVIGPKIIQKDQLLTQFDAFGRAIQQLPINAATDTSLKTLNNYIQFLISNGDAVAKSRHLCFGFYDWGVENASSHIEGYVFVDPRAVFKLRSLSERSMLSEEILLAHEFAHQLQFWNPAFHIFEKDLQTGGTVKRIELAADCVGAALVSQRHSYLLRSPEGAQIWEMEKQGLRAALQELSDFDFENVMHHGTALERMMAANEGIRLIEQTYGNVSPIGRITKPLTGATLLEHCNRYVSIAFRK